MKYTKVEGSSNGIIIKTCRNDICVRWDHVENLLEQINTEYSKVKQILKDQSKEQ